MARLSIDITKSLLALLVNSRLPFLFEKLQGSSLSIPTGRLILMVSQSSQKEVHQKVLNALFNSTIVLPGSATPGFPPPRDIFRSCPKRHISSVHKAAFYSSDPFLLEIFKRYFESKVPIWAVYMWIKSIPWHCK